ncbi:aminoglycoside phosphotransferase family protein [Psychrobacillus sp. FSL H8-0483]|uniref:aminoglycoside phosphotransferase family protein n=1 Tax=Psychrobacillus sp. FSL H8-0483 TaxID=2921389 RepID=UPI003159F914
MNKQIKPNIPSQFEKFLGKINSFSYPKRQGATSEVALLHTDKGQFVCKVASKLKYREWLSQEADIMKCLNAETDLPLPTYFHFVENEEKSYLLMSLEEGVTLREALQQFPSDAEKCALIQSFGELLQQLHETQPPTDWITEENWLDTQLQKAAYNLQNYEVDGNQELLDQLIKHPPIRSKQVLIHGDCTIDNVLVSNGRVQTFIDLSGAAYGDPRCDIALAIRSIKDNEAMIKAFYKGYSLQMITKEEFDYFDGGLYEFF